MKYNCIIDNNKKLWFISDLHFNHRKLTRLDEDRFEITRPFDTIDEMNQCLFDNWQNTVNKEDIVIFAGDLIMNTQMSKIKETFDRWYKPLNGIKIWLKGNHDGQIITRLKKCGYNINTDLNVYHQYLYFNYKNKNVFIQHYPYQDFDDFSKNLDIEKTIFIYGHTHLSEKISYINDRKCHNICVEARMKPTSFEELVKE